MTGLSPNTKTVAKNMRKWQIMTRRKKSSKNYGANFSPFKIKIPLKMKKLLLRCSNRFTL